MRVLFCGSGTFAQPSLEAIARTDHQLIGVVTQPPRRAGRGGKKRSTVIAETARQFDIPPLETGDINQPDVVEQLSELNPDAICVVEFGQFLRKPVRDLAKVDSFNLHASLLPKLRGAAPVNWAIIRGYHETGVTTFSLVDKMDAGAIYLQKKTKIEPDETAASLRERLAKIGASAVCETLGLLSAGWAQSFEQDESQATRAPRMKKSDGIIDWNASAVQIRNLINGTYPWPGGQAVFIRDDGKEIPLTFARVHAKEENTGAAPGTVLRDKGIATGAGKLIVEKVKPAGKRLIDWRDFVNGYRVREGSQFVVRDR